jgi:hypothetical protein
MRFQQVVQGIALNQCAGFFDVMVKVPVLGIQAHVMPQDSFCALEHLAGA